MMMCLPSAESVQAGPSGDVYQGKKETVVIENLRECDSSKCLLCSRRPGDPERYVDNSDLPTTQYPDVLEGLVMRNGSGQLGSNANKKRTAAECYPCTSEDVSLEQIVPQQGERDFTTGGRLSKIPSQKDLLVPQMRSACVLRKESYMARESNRDLRDKVISSIDFRRGGEYFATATTCKEICIHKLESSGCGGSESGKGKGSQEDTVKNGESISASTTTCSMSSSPIDPRWVHRAPSKLSSLVWNNNSNKVTVGDFEGQLTRVDVETGHIIEEVDEKSNSAILDLKRNKYFNTNCLLTASKSGAVKLWSEDLHSYMPIVSESNSVPVCSVAFNPFNANLVATALSNSMLCVYDIRNCEVPIYTTDVARENPVAHIEYCSNGDLVCSTLNNEITKWERDSQNKRSLVTSGAENFVSLQLQKKCASFLGHKLTRHFVGLSVNHRDFIATGSEDGKAYIYHERSASPVAICDVSGCSPTSSCYSSGSGNISHASTKQNPITTAVEWIPSPENHEGGETMSLLVAAGMKVDRFELNL